MGFWKAIGELVGRAVGDEPTPAQREIIEQMRRANDIAERRQKALSDPHMRDDEKWWV